MSPYVWSMCTDSNELGRMPPLESLRSVSPADAVFEVVLVDKNTDMQLRELEDKAVGIAYMSQEVLDLAAKLAQLVADQMGGPVLTDEQLVDAWNSSTFKLTQQLGSLVLPIGRLQVGLGRHRALLFKVCNSIGSIFSLKYYLENTMKYYFCLDLVDYYIDYGNYCWPCY